MAKNKVIAGDYQGKNIAQALGVASIVTGIFKSILLDKSTIKEYEVIDEESQKSVTSAVGRAFVGGVILGPVGWLAGITAKNKGTHTLAIEFNDGKKSLIEVDDKIHKAIVTRMF